MRISKNKRGLSHIEFIISLVIFMTFVLVLLTFLNPVKENVNTQVILDSFEMKLIDYSEISVLTGSVIVNNAGMKECFSVESLCIKKVIARKDGRIKAENGGKTQIENKGAGVYNLFYSDGFEEIKNDKNCEELNETDYSFGLTRESQIVSLEKLDNLAYIYNNRYADAKQELGINSNEFGFIIYDLNGTEIASAFKQKTNEDIIAREISIETIDKNANIKRVIINMRIW